MHDVEVAWKHGELPRFHWAGFSLYFGQAAVRAVHIEKLAGFVLDVEGLRNALGSCVHALARELHSPRIVYGPDSFSPFQEVLDVDKGRSLEEILSDAKRLCGAAAGSIRGMADENEELNLDLGCYFIETVHLRNGTGPDDRDGD